MDEFRIYLLDGWRESSLYSDRERAALAWTEALTLVAETGAPDADYAMIEQAFSDSECVNLTLAIGAINLWNRLQIGFLPCCGLMLAAGIRHCGRGLSRWLAWLG
jgi:alkylhydroperoxidase family enzyme